MTTQFDNDLTVDFETWKVQLEDNKDPLAAAIEQQLSATKQKTVDNFLDELCCALEELSGKEVFDCFVEAVQSQHEYTQKEYDKTSELLDLLTRLQ
tara:strand:- start:48 stop:335 length:288 start_codon:yes stop_codon:yes gene_type:complete